MKHRLRGLIPQGRQKEAAVLLPFVNDDPPDEPGHWTAKDQLAHLMAWREVAIAELDAARTGSRGPEVTDDDDAENAKVYARTHHRPAASIMEEAARSWDDLEAAFEKSSEDELASPRARNPDEPYWRVMVTHGCSHLAAHLGYWLRDQGDDGGDKNITRWARDVLNETFPGEALAGVGEYNLGCFYAVRGNAAEAIPYLRRGIQLRPDLLEWAKQDTDLDPIRSDPDVISLLEPQ